MRDGRSLAVVLLVLCNCVDCQSQRDSPAWPVVFAMRQAPSIGSSCPRFVVDSTGAVYLGNTAPGPGFPDDWQQLGSVDVGLVRRLVAKLPRTRTVFHNSRVMDGLVVDIQVGYGGEEVSILVFQEVFPRSVVDLLNAVYDGVNERGKGALSRLEYLNGGMSGRKPLVVEELSAQGTDDYYAEPLRDVIPQEDPAE